MTTSPASASRWMAVIHANLAWAESETQIVLDQRKADCPSQKLQVDRQEESRARVEASRCDHHLARDRTAEQVEHPGLVRGPVRDLGHDPYPRRRWLGAETRHLGHAELG